MKKIALILIFSMLLLSLQMLVSCSNTEDPIPTQPSETEAEPTAKPTAKPTSKPTETEKVEGGKEIDIYIIAGQSNASGYTGIDWTVLESLWSDCRKGSKYVLYAGKAEYDEGGVNKYNEVFWANAKGGQGIGANSMGAEVGMAKKLGEEYYNEESGKTAGIIKFAHGGTSLLNKTTGSNAIHGNWISPSYAAQKGLDFSGLTGGLYRMLLEQVKKNVQQLQTKGYDKINIKGLFWMQCESDRSQIDEYKKAFKCFANDIRDDLSAELGMDLYELPIIIGEISKTFGGADTETMAINAAFIDMQRELAQEVYEVYTIASSEYEITTWDPATGTSVNDPRQKDAAHWNTAKMFAIGELLGECILENILGQ